MRAYPLRWRETFGDDLLGVLADVTEPEAERVPAAEAVEIVRAGGACRWREHPPLWNWLLYRVFNARLPAEYQWWAIDDLRGKFWLFRDEVYSLIVMMPGFYLLFFVPEAFVPLSLGFDPHLWFGLVVLLPLIVISFLTRKMRIRYAWRKAVGTEAPPEFWTDRARARAQRKAKGPSHA